MRSQCPVGYEAVDLSGSVDCPVVEDVLSESDSSSLWLIKIPHDFDVSSLSGQNVILNGSQDLLSINNNKNKDKRYEIQSKAAETAELSSFSVLLPSSQKKSLRVVSSIHGQMRVIQSVSVPPPTLPDSSDSLTAQRQSHSKNIKKWKPFGHREPQKLKEKKTKEPKERTKETAGEGRKKNKEQKTANSEGFSLVEREEKEKSKRDSPKKKKKDKERHEFDLSRVKSEPELNGTRNDNQNSQSVRKRKGNDTDKFEDGERENGLTPTKQRKKENKTKNVDTVMVKQEGDSDDAGRRFVSEVGGGFDLARVKSEPRETPKKAKKHKKHKGDKLTV